ncbi:MAG: hypothetical protein GY716_20945 [bacterium]|nr:hypothetical protein [bacterium]
MGDARSISMPAGGGGDVDRDGLADDYGDCYQDDIIELEATDTSNPPVSQSHWYLVTGENFTAEGSLGENSDRVERPNTGVCP